MWVQLARRRCEYYAHALSIEGIKPDAAVVGFGARVTADLISLREQRKQLQWGTGAGGPSPPQNRRAAGEQDRGRRQEGNVSTKPMREK